ncbi:ACP phosphodiesterase [Ferruginibacter sp. SUN106]|uniref:acyl carrier protein phosphodiesterase n=1 Tax=Ferruginibacter sp. SUN106 TaxID=2978348 RepID=UPI003D35C0C4
MNFLAHAHLSFNQPPIVVGNMISDFVKGKKQFDYPEAVHKGIMLHRAIDTFTDTHAVTQQLKLFFKPQYRLYAGAFTDVVYDHFLANDTSIFLNDDALKQFALSTYTILNDNFAMLPPGFQRILPYMKEYDWLFNYKSTSGIEKSFTGLVRRSAYLKESAIAFAIFNEHYEAMNLLYHDFYPDLNRFAAHHLQQLLNA